VRPDRGDLTGVQARWSFRWLFHLGLLGPTEAHWPDDPSDLTCKDSTQQYAVDDPLLSCKQQVGGSSPPASSQNRRSQACKRQRPPTRRWKRRRPDAHPRIIAALLRKAAATSFPHEAAACREKAEALRARYGL
jgi:hypothetical protein